MVKKEKSMKSILIREKREKNKYCRFKEKNYEKKNNV